MKEPVTDKSKDEKKSVTNLYDLHVLIEMGTEVQTLACILIGPRDNSDQSVEIYRERSRSFA
jgi:hypothetical protein